MSRIIRLPELEKRLGISRATIYRLEKKGSFPKRKILGLNSIGWLEEEVDSYVQKLPSVHQFPLKLKNK